MKANMLNIKVVVGRALDQRSPHKNPDLTIKTPLTHLSPDDICSLRTFLTVICRHTAKLSTMVI